MNTKKLITALALAAAAMSAQAGEPTGNTVFGQPSCGDWLAPSHTVSEVRMDAWMVGYMSGLNANETDIKADVLGNVDVPSMRVYITNYCRRNPLDKVGKAANALYLDLIRRLGRGV